MAPDDTKLGTEQQPHCGRAARRCDALDPADSPGVLPLPWGGQHFLCLHPAKETCVELVMRNLSLANGMDQWTGVMK